MPAWVADKLQKLPLFVEMPLGYQQVMVSPVIELRAIKELTVTKNQILKALARYRVVYNKQVIELRIAKQVW